MPTKTFSMLVNYQTFQRPIIFDFFCENKWLILKRLPTIFHIPNTKQIICFLHIQYVYITHLFLLTKDNPHRKRSSALDDISRKSILPMK